MSPAGGGAGRRLQLVMKMVGRTARRFPMTLSQQHSAHSTGVLAIGCLPMRKTVDKQSEGLWSAEALDLN